MERLVLVGAGGCMRELFWQIATTEPQDQDWVVDGYIDVMEDLNLENMCPCRYLGNDDYLLNRSVRTNVVICISNPDKREELVQRYSKNPNLVFPDIILSKEIAPDLQLGKGVVISRGCMVSSNVTLGDFTYLGLGCIIGHDSSVGEYVTMNQRVTLGGSVTIGKGTYLSLGVNVRKGIQIGDYLALEAGYTVLEDIK